MSDQPGSTTSRLNNRLAKATLLSSSTLAATQGGAERSAAVGGLRVNIGERRQPRRPVRSVKHFPRFDFGRFGAASTAYDLGVGLGTTAAFDWQAESLSGASAVSGLGAEMAKSGRKYLASIGWS